MNQLMDDIISTANNFASNFAKECNFSIESLEFIEHILEDMGTKELNEDDIYNISSTIGCYVFETARRNYGGVYYWMNSEQQPLLVTGEPEFAVTIRAWQKVKGRVINGKEDSIPFYIDGYREHIEKGKHKKGYYVNIV